MIFVFVFVLVCVPVRLLSTCEPVSGVAVNVADARLDGSMVWSIVEMRADGSVHSYNVQVLSSVCLRSPGAALEVQDLRGNRNVSAVLS